MVRKMIPGCPTPFPSPYRKYKCILIDPPWPQVLTGKVKRRENRVPNLPYMTMTLEEIARLPVATIADDDAHIWLWTTNQFLAAGFQVLEQWGFRYLAPIHWIKPSGLGAWFIHRTQTLLFGYKSKCVFPLGKYKPNVIFANSTRGRHSQKPDATYEYIESISPGPRIELFARRALPGWDVWGNEI